ncbi:hemolysin family protein [Kistimonas scapharcae]|uniref:Hemolysin family protein n=1 Tax=Kistimonas scapharcae TaxID=1036133 RepID=A0ABP8UVL5_9GAMM
MLLLVVFALVAILVSFLCSVFEAVLLSITPSWLAGIEQKGDRSAKRIKALKDNIDRPLAAILTLNTVAHTAGAAGVGAQAAVVFGNQYLGLVSAVMTVLILVLSEIIPKTIGATWWRQLAPMTAICLNWMVRILSPVIWCLELLTSRMTHGHGNDSELRAEISALAELGRRQGELASEENQILQSLLRFRDGRLNTIMTPRTVVFSLPESVTTAEYLEKYSDKGFSRIPVYEGEPDDITGFVLRAEVLAAHHQSGGTATLGSLCRPILRVLDRERVDTLFSRLVVERSHIAMVVDEYGDMQGVVTLEDLIETLLGMEIVDECDRDVDMQSVARRRRMRWLKKHSLQMFGSSGKLEPANMAPVSKADAAAS